MNHFTKEIRIEKINVMISCSTNHIIQANIQYHKNSLHLSTHRWYKIDVNIKKSRFVCLGCRIHRKLFCFEIKWMHQPTLKLNKKASEIILFLDMFTDSYVWFIVLLPLVHWNTKVGVRLTKDIPTKHTCYSNIVLIKVSLIRHSNIRIDKLGIKLL